MTNTEMCNKYFPHLRVLGDFDDYEFETEKEFNDFFTKAHRNGIDGSIKPFAIGGSQAGAIEGVGYYPPQRTALEILYPDRFPISESLEEIFEQGHRAEPYIRESFKRETGLTVIEWNVQVVNPKYPHCLADIDGLIIEDGKIGVYEGKSPVNWTKQNEWKKIKKAGNKPENWYLVPMNYLMQVWYYMAVYEIDFAYICAGGWGFKSSDIAYCRIDRLPPDSELALMNDCEAFVDNTAKGIMPSGDKVEDKKELLTYISEWYRGKPLKFDPDYELPEIAASLSEEIIKLQDEIEIAKKDFRDKITEKEEQLNGKLATLAEMMGENQRASAKLNDKTYTIVYAADSRYSFDKDLCKEKYPDVYDEVYKKKEGVRKITVLE